MACMIEMRNACKILVKNWRTIPLGGTKHRCEGNIKMNVNFINLAHGCVLMNTVMDLWVL